MVQRLSNVKPAADKIDVGPTQSERFPTTQTQRQRDRPQRIEPILTRLIQETGSLLRRPLPRSPLVARRHLHLTGDVAAHQLVLVHRMLQSCPQHPQQCTPRTGTRILLTTLLRHPSAASSLRHIDLAQVVGIARPPAILVLGAALTLRGEPAQPRPHMLGLKRSQLLLTQPWHQVEPHQLFIRTVGGGRT